MKIQILGSAAAERYPALWCECKYCVNARKNKEIRRAAVYLIDEDTLVDFGPDIHWQVTEFGIDLTRLKRVILTHSHGDHLSPIEFLWRKEWFSKVFHPVKVFGSAPSLAAILSFVADDSSILNLEKDLKLETCVLGNSMEVDDEGMKILAMDANHAPGKQPLIYLISRGGKSILIGNDTGWFPDQTWKALEGRKIDLAILDCTCGFTFPDCANGHMGINTMLKTKKRLTEMGCLTEGSRCVANHFSHNGGGSQAEYEAFLGPQGVETAIDGFTIDL